MTWQNSWVWNPLRSRLWWGVTEFHCRSNWDPDSGAVCAGASLNFWNGLRRVVRAAGGGSRCVAEAAGIQLTVGIHNAVCPGSPTMAQSDDGDYVRLRPRDDAESQRVLALC